MNGYCILIILIICGKYALDYVVDTLNLRHAGTTLPAEFEGWYDGEKYKRSQQYLRENTRFHIFEDTLGTVLILAVILSGGFNLVDRFARGFGFGPVGTGLIFVGVIMFAGQLAAIPFSAYHTFVIEAKYGFNKTTVKTFISDLIKGWLLSAILGGIAFSGVVWFFAKVGGWAWVYCWIAVTLFELFILFIAPVVIMPLFNKFIPLKDGELKTAIETYALQQHFSLQGVFYHGWFSPVHKIERFFYRIRTFPEDCLIRHADRQTQRGRAGRGPGA
jgi:hypothetical protein